MPRSVAARLCSLGDDGTTACVMSCSMPVSSIANWTQVCAAIAIDVEEQRWVAAEGCRAGIEALQSPFGIITNDPN